MTGVKVNLALSTRGLDLYDRRCQCVVALRARTVVEGDGVGFEDDRCFAAAQSGNDLIDPTLVLREVCGTARAVLATVAIGDVVDDENRYPASGVGVGHVLIDVASDVAVPVAEPAGDGLGTNL